MDINHPHPQERPEHRAARRGWTLTREHLPVLGWVYRLAPPEGRVRILYDLRDIDSCLPR